MIEIGRRHSGVRQSWLAVALGAFVFASAPCAALAVPPHASTPSTKAPVRPRAREGAKLLHSPVQDPALWPLATPVEWPMFQLGPITSEDAELDKTPAVPMRIGINRPSPAGPISPQTHGQWIQLDDETRVWRMVMHAPGAQAIRVHFQQCDLPPSAVLIVSDRRERVVDNVHLQGPTDGGDFWSVAIPGSRVFLELRCPAGAEEPTLVIDEISHIYRRGASDAQALRTPTLLACQEDVNCHPVDINARDAVGRMVFTVPGEGTFLCTGALLNDNDPNTLAGYFLTANHCLSTQAAVDSLTVYWFYQTDSCNGSVPSYWTLPRSDGGTLLDTSSLTDFTFIRLADDPNDGQGLAAWTTLAPTGTVHGIHHPGGLYKRYSAGALTTAEPICETRSLTYYHYLDWTIGITEGGSSGSPLFNQNWEVVGQLFGVCRYSGTIAGCDNPEDYNALYGKFASTYAFYDVSDYLNLITPDDGYEDNDTLATAPLLDGGNHNLILVDYDDYFTFEVTRDATVSATASFSTADMNLDLELLTTGGALLDASTSLLQATETVSAEVVPGTYVIHASKVSQWGGPYTLTIDPGPTKPVADYDDDGDVDMNDFAFIQRCSSGIGVPVVSPECDEAPLDGDTDVDPTDMLIFFDCFSGANVPALIDCGQ